MMWKPTLAMIKENPAGVGAGNWWVEFPSYAPGIDYPKAYIEEQFLFPHNDFMWEWSEVGTTGFLCYLGIFVSAIYFARHRPYLLMVLAGYIVIASFSTLRNRTFFTVVLGLILLNACERNRVIKQPRILLTFLIFTMVVFGFRLRSSIYDKRAIRASSNIAKVTAASKGCSVFSTLTDLGMPWKTVEGLNNFYIGNRKICISQLKQGHKHNPFNINALNGAGIAYGLENNIEKSNGYFRKALEICPAFEAAKTNLKVRRNGN
jgi:hypothetical protein